MRILITGGNGQLGRDLRSALAHEDVVALSHDQLDVADAGAVLAAVRDIAPAVIVHCAAMTDTARCEREPDAARAVNALGTANLARVCVQPERWLIAVSTNEVFDGLQREPYGEDDATGAVNAYGASKLEGEQLATAMQADTSIVRTSWLYGDGGNNFVEKVLAAARAGKPLRFVSDEVSTPTSTADLAAAIKALIDRNAGGGIYHLANEGEASRLDWAREILRLAGLEDATVESTTTPELRAGGYDGPRKPPYSVLANNRARALGVTMRPWRDALSAYFERAHATARG